VLRPINATENKCRKKNKKTNRKKINNIRQKNKQKEKRKEREIDYSRGRQIHVHQVDREDREKNTKKKTNRQEK
jgi:hypothetical protein